MIMAESLFKIVEIEINQKCNLKCSYCPNSKLDKSLNAEMAPEVFSSIINQLSDIKYDGYVSLEFYNEPLLCSNLDKYILEIISKLPNVKITLYTNGTLLTQERFNSLYEMGVHIFFITKQEHVNNYVFDSVYENLRDEQKGRVYFQDHKDMDKTNRGGALELGDQDLPLVFPCHIPSFLTLVTSNGDVLFCFEDFFRTGVMGNICKENIVKIWNSDQYKQLRNDLKHFKRYKYHPCKECNRTCVFEKHFKLIEKVEE